MDWKALMKLFAEGTGGAHPPPDFGEHIPDKEMLTAEEAAPFLGYTNVESFRRVVRQGKSPVPVKKMGRRMYVRRYDLTRYLWRS